MIKNIIFDLEGVVLDWEDTAKAIWRKDVLDLLSSLQAFNIYYLTNILVPSGSYFDTTICKELKDFGFLGGLASHHSKFEKPQLEFFLELMSKYNLEPSESIFIDDKESNVKAAIKLGMYGINNSENTKLAEELNTIIYGN
jgi:putative hydrolase of the HAD superfamily